MSSNASIIYSGDNSYIYRTDNDGALWNPVINDTQRLWAGIVTDSSGAKVAAVAQNEYVHVSNDGGATWFLAQYS